MLSNENVSRLLRSLRETSGRKQDELARLLNITRQAYSNYEVGIRAPSLEDTVKLTLSYGLSMNEFLRCLYLLKNGANASDLCSAATMHVMEPSEVYGAYIETPVSFQDMYAALNDYERELLQCYRLLSNDSKDALYRFVHSL